MLPITKVQPEYPSVALRKGMVGWVVVEFEVDARGQVIEPKIIDDCVHRMADQECDPDLSGIFNSSSLNAASQFLYIPRFEGGKPISTPGVQNKLTFDLAYQ